MPFYRIFTVGDDGHIHGPPENVTCDDDLAAVRIARSIQSGFDLEVWQETRRVAVLKPKDQ
jgi:hypothetical protein